MGRRALLVLILGGSLCGGTACDKKSVIAPSLVASCSAQPASGQAPLAVTFALNVAGAEGTFSVAIDYGDGTQGSEASQSHTYGTAGAYNAVFSVATVSQSARCTTTVVVSPGTGPTPSPSPTPAQNRPPEPSYRTEPAAIGGVVISGAAPLEIHFDMCRTVDPDGDRLFFEMDLNGDGVFEYHGPTGVDCRHIQVYPAGTYAPKLCVSDVACDFWPICDGAGRLHPRLCRTYSVTASP